MLINSTRVRREQISVRLEAEVLTVVEEAAEAERRTVSNFVRNILIDFAKAREQQASPRTS
jgi:uncharacterized protein (DUF1778 family)